VLQPAIEKADDYKSADEELNEIIEKLEQDAAFYYSHSSEDESSFSSRK
jgi:hypothetical protein